jgi:SSS family transporter
VFAVAIVVKISLAAMLSGMGEFSRDVTAIAIVTALTLIYTFEGGLAAVIWTDVIQIAIYVTGTLVGVYTILHLVPGGWRTIAEVAGPAGKFHVINLQFSFHNTYTLWSGLIGGAFLTTASHGTDQLIVQRLLSARTQRESKLALLSSGVFVLCQFALFLLVGAMLFVFYKLYPPAVKFATTDMVFPTFIVTRMPQVIRGVLIAAILAAAMSNLSAALNSLASTSVMDLYARLRPGSTDERRMQLAKLSTVAWAFVMFALAILARNGGKVVEVGLSIASVAYGALLGVFLLGVLAKRATELGSMVGMICGFAFNIYLWQFTKISFTWWVAFGSALTFAVGYIASLALPSQPSQERASEQ